MNNGDNIKNELDELLEENLIKDFKITINDINKFEFTIVTLEDKKLDLETSINYCYKITNIKDDETLYETFEQILNKHSEKYSERFGNILTEKLNQLLQRNQEDDSN
jgi:hypothetical protein